jgi:hypothetical protein
MSREGKEKAYRWMKRLARDSFHADRDAVLQDYFVDFGVALEMQVGMHSTGGVDVGVCRVTATSGL